MTFSHFCYFILYWQLKRSSKKWDWYLKRLTRTYTKIHVYHCIIFLLSCFDVGVSFFVATFLFSFILLILQSVVIYCFSVTLFLLFTRILFLFFHTYTLHSNFYIVLHACQSYKRILLVVTSALLSMLLLLLLLLLSLYCCLYLCDKTKLNTKICNRNWN